MMELLMIELLIIFVKIVFTVFLAFCAHIICLKFWPQKPYKAVALWALVMAGNIGLWDYECENRAPILSESVMSDTENLEGENK